jgi:hypothetical protein
VSDVASGEGFGIAAQGIVHEAATERGAGAVVFDVHSAQFDIEPTVVQGFLGIGGNEMNGDVAARTVNLLHRQQIFAKSRG